MTVGPVGVLIGYQGQKAFRVVLVTGAVGLGKCSSRGAVKAKGPAFRRFGVNPEAFPPCFVARRVHRLDDDFV